MPSVDEFSGTIKICNKEINFKSDPCAWEKKSKAKWTENILYMWKTLKVIWIVSLIDGALKILPNLRVQFILIHIFHWPQAIINQRTNQRHLFVFVFNIRNNKSCSAFGFHSAEFISLYFYFYVCLCLCLAKTYIVRF